MSAARPLPQLWVQMERFAREAEWRLHLKLLAYFRGHGPAPEPGDFELVGDARVLASEHLQRWLQEQAERVNRLPFISCQ